MVRAEDAERHLGRTDRRRRSATSRRLSASAPSVTVRPPAPQPASRNDKRESERYERAAKVAMEIAMKISDDLMRDDAVHRIVGLCMTANDTKTAQILYRAIHASWIRETIQRDHPTLSS